MSEPVSKPFVVGLWFTPKKFGLNQSIAMDLWGAGEEFESLGGSRYMWRCRVIAPSVTAAIECAERRLEEIVDQEVKYTGVESRSRDDN